MRKQRAFASLTEEEINQIAEWLRAETYDDVIERVAKPRPEGFGLKISRKPLQLLHAKLYRLARNWKEVGQRVCRQFQISPEEEARRAELHKTWKQPHVRPNPPLNRCKTSRVNCVTLGAEPLSRP